MIETAQAYLSQYFGFSEFRPGQSHVIKNLLTGNSSVAVFPTGSGKSLCYQLPALCFSGLTLVVSPLIALMKDQIDGLHKIGISAERLDSTLNADEYKQIMNRVASGETKILYIAPERFNNERFREAIKDINIDLFAIDEAHCVSEWGHNFRPDYLKLGSYAKQLKVKRVIALTATATSKVIEDICKVFSINSEHVVKTGFYRPNLHIHISSMDIDKREEELIYRLKKKPPGSTIIYVTQQKTSELLSNKLNEGGFLSCAYHAGMKAMERDEVQEWFMRQDDAIVVATIAFGMGIDKSNIRYVYHYNIPKSLENYAQEIGRAGRDGKVSICEILANIEDCNILRNFAYGDTPSERAVELLVQDIFSSGREIELSLYDISHKYDIKPLVLKTLLTYLEIQGYLKSGTPFYAEYQFYPIVSISSILDSFSGERRKFLSHVFTCSTKHGKWSTIDINLAMQSISSNRERIIRALDYLYEKEMISLKVSGLRNRYYKLMTPDVLSDLSKSLYGLMRNRETSQIDKLNKVVEFIELDSCYSMEMAKYFGEDLDAPCGHCSWCLGGGKVDLGAFAENDYLNDDAQRKIKSFIHANRGIRKPELIARLLCGISSPVIVKQKLKKDPLFGELSNLPYKKVENLVKLSISELID